MTLPVIGTHHQGEQEMRLKSDGGSWSNLESNLHREIVCALWEEGKTRSSEQPVIQDSLNALMQTCKSLRLLVSSFISKMIVGNDMLALQCFPRHATLRYIYLYMHPAEATMWLLTTFAAAKERLESVDIAEIDLYAWEEDDPSLLVDLEVSPKSAIQLIGALSKSCPRLKQLYAKLHRDALPQEVIAAFFKTLGTQV